MSNKWGVFMIKVLHKALNVLEIMSQSKKDVFTLNELANICDIPKSTLAGILKDLCEAKYLETTMLYGCIGRVRRISTVPCLYSSENVLIVMAGIRNKNRI